MNAVNARKVRRWPSSVGMNIETNTDGFDYQEIFIPDSQAVGQYKNQAQHFNCFFQQREPHNQRSMQIGGALLRELQQQHNRQSRVKFQEGTFNNIKEKKTTGKVEQLRQRIQKNRILMEQDDIVQVESFAGGDQTIPSDEDYDCDTKVVGVSFLTYSSDDCESDVEIGATLISDVSDVDSSDEDSGSDIEIGTSVQAIRRERLDSTGSINLGVSFQTMVGDETMAPDEEKQKTNVNSHVNTKYSHKDNQNNSKIKKFNQIFGKFRKKQHVRCSFRINALLGKIRGKKLSVRNKRVVRSITRKLCHERQAAAIADADLETDVVSKLAQEGFLNKIFSCAASHSSRRSKAASLIGPGKEKQVRKGAKN